MFSDSVSRQGFDVGTILPDFLWGFMFFGARSGGLFFAINCMKDREQHFGTPAGARDSVGGGNSHRLEF